MIRLDPEDKEALTTLAAWALRWSVAAAAVLASAGVLGVAYRIFDLVRG